MTITPLDILILAILVFGLYRLYVARRGSNKNEPLRRTGPRPSDLRPPPLPRQPPDQPPDQPQDQPPDQPQDQPPDQPQDQPPDELEARRQANDAYRRAEAAWDHFRSRPAGSPDKPHPDTAPPDTALPDTAPPDTALPDTASDAAPLGQGAVAANVAMPHGFDADDFLTGAKAIYARVVEAWADRDLDDLRQFTTDKAYLDFARRAETETRPLRSELLLVNAQLVDMQDEGPRLRTTVFYDATYSGAEGSRQAQEVWGFVRSAAEANSHWLLDEIRPVEDSFTFQQ